MMKLICARVGRVVPGFGSHGNNQNLTLAKTIRLRRHIKID